MENKIQFLKNITQDEIEKMINDGRKIFWKNEGYKVVKDSLNQFLIIHHSGDCVGLKSAFWNETTCNDFFEV